MAARLQSPLRQRAQQRRADRQRPTTAFRNAISAALKNVRLRQGSRNESRTIDPQYGDVHPASRRWRSRLDFARLDGTQNQFVNAAVEAGTSSPVVFVYLPLQNVDDSHALAIDLGG